MTTKLVRGRGRNSQLVVALDDLHVFVFGPSLGAVGSGVTVRRRRRDGLGWIHWRLLVGQRNPPRQNGKRPGGKRPRTFVARRSLTVCELCRWETRPGTSDRYGVKAYLRLKAGPGGRELG